MMVADLTLLAEVLLRLTKKVTSTFLNSDPESLAAAVSSISHRTLKKLYSAVLSQQAA